MTAEQALEEARLLWGERAAIRNDDGQWRCVVGECLEGAFVPRGRGGTWEDALAVAEGGRTVQRTKVTPFGQARDPGADLQSGAVLGNFRIVRPLGKGGMGAVYVAEHARTGRLVAVKVLHEQLARDPRLLARFQAEARALNVMRHENIVEVLEIDTLGNGRPYFAMELLEGQPLTGLTGHPMDPEVALPILIQVLDALDAAHEAGVVHRDLKPENIFLTCRGSRSNVVKLLDFGIAKFRGPGLASRKTTLGTLVGTPEYMAPEQCAAGEVDGRADLYAVGVISYLLATGELPFWGLPLTQLLLAHMKQMPAPPVQVVPSVSPPWSEATMRALAKSPIDRYASAAEFKAVLEDALAEIQARRLMERGSTGT